MQVSERRSELDARLACVTFAEKRLLAAFEREVGLDVELYGDPDREAYAALGFGRASLARVWLDLRVWARYAALLAGGRRPRAPEQDTLQLGGDVVLDPEGRIGWIYRSRGPEDRPSVDELISALRAAAPETA